MKLALAFFKRDAQIALSYRVSFIMQFVGNLMLLGLLYYMGKTIGGDSLPALSRYGGSFLAFILVGVALTDCVLVSLISFASQIREGQTTGTLEATLMSPVGLPAILIYSSLWNYFLSAVRFLLYLVVGGMMFGLQLGNANILSALVIFLLTVLCFMGIGILWAGVVLLIKRGESMMTVMGYLIMLIAGVFFPTELLPLWVQKLSLLIPLTHSLEGMRFALIQGHNLQQLLPILLKLGGFAIVFLGAGITGFNAAVKIAKQSGSLTQY